MDGHLRHVRTQQKKLFDMMKEGPSAVHPMPQNNFTISSSEKILAEIKQSVKKLENKSSKLLRRSNSNLRSDLQVDEEKFYKGLTADQRDAGSYFLNRIRSLSDVDQLLMLLHGQPGSGKSFFIVRIRDYTNLRMKITASSGIVAVSLGGSTLE